MFPSARLGPERMIWLAYGMVFMEKAIADSLFFPEQEPGNNDGALSGANFYISNLETRKKCS